MRFGFTSLVKALTRKIGVDVRGDDLLVNRAPCRLARERAAALETAMNDRAVGAGRRSNADPIAHGRKVGGGPAS